MSEYRVSCVRAPTRVWPASDKHPNKKMMKYSGSQESTRPLCGQTVDRCGIVFGLIRRKLE